MKTRFLTAILVPAILVVFLIGCSKEALQPAETSELTSAQSGTTLDATTAAIPGYKKFVIEKGAHYANGIHFTPYSGTVLSFSAVFTNSAKYNFTDPSIKYDQNTLYGFADNGMKHQQYSARFGWRWFDGQLQIAAYTINNGVPTIDQIGSVALNVPSTYSIAISADGTEYIFTLNGEEHRMPRQSTTQLAGPYNLLPYFGGNAVAPHKVVIYVQKN